MSKTTAYRTLKAVADRFTQMGKKKTEGGQEEAFNELQYMLESNCGQIIWSMQSQLDYMEKKTLPKAQDDLRELLRENNGTEIPLNALRAKTSWVKRLQGQIAEQQAFIAELNEAYKEIVGRQYQQPARRKTEAAGDDAVAEALALIGETVNPACSYNSDSGKAQYN